MLEDICTDEAIANPSVRLYKIDSKKVKYHSVNAFRCYGNNSVRCSRLFLF